jgi:hypothetical protein
MRDLHRPRPPAVRAARCALAYDAAVEERAACAQLKRRFEAAGFHIEDNQLFDENGVRFEIDGFDAGRRVGYEYITKEAGDGWDVDADVIAALAERSARGELHVLVVDEADAPDAATLDAAIDQFLQALREGGVSPDAPAPAEPPRPADVSDAADDKPARPPAPPKATGKKKSSRKSR